LLTVFHEKLESINLVIKDNQCYFIRGETDPGAYAFRVLAAEFWEVSPTLQRACQANNHKM
jgi:hypothetical protein